MSENLHNAPSKNNHLGRDGKSKILHRTATYAVPHTISTDEALDKLKLRLANLPQTRPHNNKRHIQVFYWLTASAALFILLFGIWRYWLQTSEINIVAEKGKHKIYTLPDSSVVSINAESNIYFNKKAFLNNRYLQLRGEAFFTVKKGSTFTVGTPYGNIKVLGTSFNVLAREASFKVSCFTGKVKVSAQKQAVTLTPGESSVIKDNVLRKYTDKDINNTSKWREGVFYFENTALKIVFEEIARQFNVTFVFQNLNGRIFTGSFSNSSLTDALDIVCIPMGLVYEIGNEGNIYIHEKPQ